MTALANLKLVVAKKPTQILPVMQRRNKLVKALHQQIELAKAQSEGRTYAPMRMRSVVNEETGLTTTVETPKRIKPWWFVAENGKVCISLRYGARTITLGSKNQNSVEVGNGAELIATLEVLRKAVADGELDQQIEAVSRATKASFKK